MNTYQVRCKECGRFTVAEEIKKNLDCCNRCEDRGWEEYAAEMRELDPYGAYGDQSRYD